MVSAPIPFLTPRQAEILAFIADTVREWGRPPSRQEIAAEFGFSTAASAQEHLQALARKGYVECSPGTARGVRLLKNADGSLVSRLAMDTSNKLLQLPLIGEVRAGQPILAEQNIERHLQLESALFSPRPDYLLRVRGDSMRDAGILPGDLLGVHRSSSARSGQIVVARIGDDVTVKTFTLDGRRANLLPANPEYAPMRVSLDDASFAIEGVVVGVIRAFDSGRLAKAVL
jgi:repressor LexA